MCTPYGKYFITKLTFKRLKDTWFQFPKLSIMTCCIVFVYILRDCSRHCIFSSMRTLVTWVWFITCMYSQMFFYIAVNLKKFGTWHWFDMLHTPSTLISSTSQILHTPCTLLSSTPQILYTLTALLLSSPQILYTLTALLSSIPQMPNTFFSTFMRCPTTQGLILRIFVEYVI